MIALIEQLSPTTRRVLRAALGVMIGIAFGLTTLALFVIGSIEFSGCFFECSDPNPVGGSLLLAGSTLTGGLVFLALGWGAGMNIRAKLIKSFVIGSAVVALFIILLFTLG